MPDMETYTEDNVPALKPVLKPAPSPIHFNRNGNYSGIDLRPYAGLLSDVEGSDFTNCNMEGMNLRSINFNRCIFRGANLMGVDLRDASLYGVDICGTRGLIGGIYRSDGHVFFAVMGHPPLMIKAGCRWMGLAEARDHWMHSDETIAILKCLEALAEARG